MLLVLANFMWPVAKMFVQNVCTTQPYRSGACKGRFHKMLLVLANFKIFNICGGVKRMF